MIFNRHAKVAMEEGYMRLSIEYTNPASRTIIFNTIGAIEEAMGIHPEVIHRKISEDKGAFSVEFGGEDHVCSRESGEFIERVLQELNITDCDCDNIIGC